MKMRTTQGKVLPYPPQLVSGAKSSFQLVIQKYRSPRVEVVAKEASVSSALNPNVQLSSG